MQNHKCALFIAAGLSAAAYAETPPPQLPVMEEYTLQRLEQIQAETVMLEAKAARARIQRELEESGIDARTANLPLNGRELAILPRTGGLPSVEEIYLRKESMTIYLGVNADDLIIADDFLNLFFNFAINVSMRENPDFETDNKYDVNAN